MIIVKLKCGLGNQMFQYALGRRLKNDSNVYVKFDLSWYDNYNEKDIPRELSIDKYKVNMQVADDNEIKKARPGKLFQLAGKIKAKFILNYHYHFDKKLLITKKNKYLDGYFQSFKYFESIRETLLGEFQMKKGFSSVGIEIEKEIKVSEEKSVALHIRRGDFVTIRKDWNGLCGVDYYIKALNEIKKPVKDIKIFIFSDDIEWAKNNLNFDLPAVFVSRPELSDAEELILMSLCKHQIIANSTFSWWAAWLNQNKRKIVIAPKNWLSVARIDTREFIPEGWIRI